jgi:phage terminase Nu1 subunit (DNA packaging protein)
MISGLHHQICDVVTTCLRTLLKDMPPAQRIEQAATLALETVNLQQTVVLCVNPAELREAVPVSQKLSELMSGGARVECRGREDVELAWGSAVNITRTRLLGVPSTAKQRIPHLEIEEVELLTTLIREALDELAAGEVKA